MEGLLWALTEPGPGKCSPRAFSISSPGGSLLVAQLVEKLEFAEGFGERQPLCTGDPVCYGGRLEDHGSVGSQES